MVIQVILKCVGIIIVLMFKCDVGTAYSINVLQMQKKDIYAFIESLKDIFKQASHYHLLRSQEKFFTS